jgi:hypothetical protein
MEYQPDLKRITGEGGVVASVEPGSIAADLGIQPDDVVVAIGERRLRDVIDYRFALADERIELLVRRGDDETIYEIEKDPDEDLGIAFVEPLFDRLRTCNNKCPFCFLTQMPKGMRRSLYLKDDDFRLGFLYGTSRRRTGSGSRSSASARSTSPSTPPTRRCARCCSASRMCPTSASRSGASARWGSASTPRSSRSRS